MFLHCNFMVCFKQFDMMLCYLRPKKPRNCRINANKINPENNSLLSINNLKLKKRWLYFKRDPWRRNWGSIWRIQMNFKSLKKLIILKGLSLNLIAAWLLYIMSGLNLLIFVTLAVYYSKLICVFKYLRLLLR